MIYVIGTSHQVHLPSWRTRQEESEAIDAFKAAVREAAARHNIRCIVEEASAEAVADTQAEASVLQALAPVIGVGHAFIDPDAAERAALRIKGVRDIEYERFMGDHDEQWEADEKAIHLSRREEEWIRRIAQGGFARPLLAVIGARHVVGFVEKCRGQAWDAEVLHELWEPSAGWQPQWMRQEN